MENILNFFRNLEAKDLWESVRIIAFSLIAYFLLRILSRLITRFILKKTSDQIKMLIQKVMVYTGTVVILFMALDAWGLNLSALLGAAGVIGIAVGIASQKSMGNIISGIFLISESAFEIGDIIRIGAQTGIVYSIDLLSIKIRTFDNLLVRVPHENLISNEVTNITRFPIRRLDYTFHIDPQTDINRLHKILVDAVRSHPLCLDEPEPFFLVKGLDESGLEFSFGVWFERDNYMKVKNSLLTVLRTAINNEGIPLAYPRIEIQNHV